MMWGWYGGPWSWWHWIAGLIMMLAFWGGLAAVIALVVRSFTAPRQTQSETSTARAILDARLARGEISVEEYRQLIAELEAGRKE